MVATSFDFSVAQFTVISSLIPTDNWALVESKDVPLVEDIRSNIPQLPFGATFRNEIFKTFSKIVDVFFDTKRQPLLTDGEFTGMFDSDGRLTNQQQLRERVFFGGVDGKIRKDVWTHLLGIYPSDLTSVERNRFILMRNQVYHHLKQNWLEKKPDSVHSLIHMIQKDVSRTDRNVEFFSVPEDHPNIVSLFNILTIHALNNPDVTYSQGMSDLASPILHVLEDEMLSYWCFAALMQRVKCNFERQGLAMKFNFHYLSLLLKRVDPELFCHLEEIGADNFFFCYRMLLLDLKREFPFDEALSVIECIWSTVPQDRADVESTVAFYHRLYRSYYPSTVNSSTTWEGIYLERNPKDIKDEKRTSLPHPWLINSGSPMSLLICLSILLINKEQILKQPDYSCLGMYLDKLVRKHDSSKVLSRARGLFVEYIKAFLDGQTVNTEEEVPPICPASKSDAHC